jgi:hypothetical protein
MRFEVKLPSRLNVWALRAAGVEVEGLSDLSLKVIEGKAKLPANVKGQYHVSDPPLEVSIAILEFDKPGKVEVSRDREGNIIVQGRPLEGSAAHMQIEIADEDVARAVKKKLDHYSIEKDGEAVSEQEHKNLYAEIEKILKREELSYEKLQRGEALTRPAIEGLMELCEKTEPIRRGHIYSLFSDNWVPKSERALVAPWLIRRFEQDYAWDDQLGLRIWENSVPAIAEDLIRLIQNRRYDHHRAPLCPALAKTKHPRAADVIASVMSEKWMGWFCMEGLRKLPGAVKHVEKIKEFLRHPEGEYRRAAKKLLTKLGVGTDIPPPPPPIHLFKGKGIPRGLEEWSTNLDMDGLAPTLQRIAKIIDGGFGDIEIAEISAVVEQMRQDQTKAFRFPIKRSGQSSDLFVVIFMDDIESPDLAIYGEPELIRKFEENSSMHAAES